MERKIFYRGTIIELINPFSQSGDVEKYMLAECFEDEFQFQIICISGYDAGRSFGYIEKDRLLMDKYAAVSDQHLLKEIKKNFGKIPTEKIKIFE